MKIVKYFYSKPTFTETLKCVTNENGDYANELAYVIKRKPRARITACGIFDTETKKLQIGVSRCSAKDLFVKSVGRELAYKRASQNPIMTVDVMDCETISSVFFEQAIVLEKRYSAIDFVKF